MNPETTNTMNTEITIDGQTFIIDLERAKELGLMTAKRKNIEFITDGDLFSDGYYLSVLVIRQGYESSKWNILNAEDHGFKFYSDFTDKGVSTQEMLDFINSRELNFVKNMNSDLKSIVKNALSQTANS
jgi:hypothetical protein